MACFLWTKVGVNLWHSMNYNYRRASDTNIREYVAAFEHVYFNFTKQGMDLPDSVMAFMLLASGSLSDSEQNW